LIDFEKLLRALKRGKLLRTIRDRDSAQGAEIFIKGKRLINFASNDYLGLANSPALREISKSVIDEFGLGSGASRLLSGGCTLHRELEKEVARFKSTEDAIVFNSGYCLNAGVISAIAGEDGAIFSDELNHASLIDGIRLSRAKKYIFGHRDLGHLEELISVDTSKNKLIVTDSVFSMDGDIAPIKGLFEIAKKHNALLYIDDAHATGVLGGGRGALAHFGLTPEPFVIQMGTFSKALGSFGAFVAGGKSLIRWLINSARSLIYTTAIPPALVGASLKALRIISTDKSLINRLWCNRELLKNEIENLQLSTTKSETPIIALLMKDNDEAIGLSAYLYERGLYAPAIRAPSVRIPRIRITISAAHTHEHIYRLVEALRDWRAR